MQFTPRPYQSSAIEWLSTRKRGLLQMPAGSGKSFVAASALNAVITAKHRTHKVRIGWMAPTTETRDQGIAAIGMFPALAKHDVKVSCVYPGLDFGELDVLIVDECFPAGTKIDGVPIEKIKKGDYVLSVNHASLCVEYKKISHVFKTRPSGLLEVKTRNGCSVRCTPNHPFFTKRGYVSACQLTSGDVVLISTQHDNTGMQKLRKANLAEGTFFKKSTACLRGLQGAIKKKPIEDCCPSVPRMRNAGYLSPRSSCHLSKNGSHTERANLLFGRVPGYFFPKTIFPNNGKNKSHVCSTVRPKKGEDVGYCKSQVIHETKSNGVEAANQRGKRDGANCYRTADRKRFRLAVQCYRQHSWRAENRIADTLQNRCRKRGFENSHRSGRRQSQSLFTQGARQKKNGIFNFARVASIEVFKPTSDGTFGGMCPDGFVYNLEVEENHNYFADGMLVHNCKHSDAPVWYAVIEKCNGARWGLDATPFGEDEERNQMRRELFGNNIFTVPRSEVQQNLAPARVIMLDDSDLILKASIDNEIDRRVHRRSHWWKGDPQELWGQVAFQVCMEVGIIGNRARNQAAVTKAREHAKDSVLMLVSQIEHGEALAAQIPGARMCYSKMGKKKRADAVEAAKSGECKCLVASSVFDEGADMPRLCVLVLVSGGRSRGRAEQRTGRVLRAFAGKSEGIIYDFHDNWFPLAAKHSRARQDVYRELGYKFSQ